MRFNDLKAADEAGLDRDDIVKVLREHGKLAEGR
jgi:hypothetical protein